ncbi:ATP-binding cassette domain-containing protein, partial [Thermodesulfobacteriota bacterium]
FGILIKAFNEFFRGAKIILIFYLGAFIVLDNKLSIGMLMAFVSWNDTFFSRVFALLDKFMEYRLLDIHLSRLSDIAFTKKEQNLEGSGPPSIEVTSNPLFEVKDLSFRYSENHPFIFNNVNLSIEKNETLAITGPSGCGKSTLIKVLSSLFQPCGGKIKMLSLDISRMGLWHYRNRTGVVLQDDGLLTGSISDNISFFDSAPDQQVIEHAAEIAAIHRDILAMPMQYNTLVGNLGAALSGGQIQRILLARAIYKNPELLFLDEATSHLDIEAEKMVNNSIKQLKMGRIIVAHRPETIKLADRVFLLTPQGLVQVKTDQMLDAG